MTKTQRQVLQALIEDSGKNLTLLSALWNSRWELLQWTGVFASLAMLTLVTAGPYEAGIVTAFALGAFVTQLAGMHRGIESWEVLVKVADIEKAKVLLLLQPAPLEFDDTHRG